VENLPEASADALTHSARLRELIAREIRQAGGWISFGRYMELVLYAPGLGYYSAGAAKFGAAGDFVTAPEISSLFGITLAQQIAALLSPDMPDLLELGAGSGKLACDLLLELARLDKLPQRYLILEASGDLRERQQRRLQQQVPQLLPRIHWLDALPASFRGVVLANEVLDALPAHVLTWRGSALYERGVSGDAETGFAWKEIPASEAMQEPARHLGVTDDFPQPYISELNLAAPALIATLAKVLERGVMLVIDYGFPRHEYYHVQRAAGTLMCHYRHRAHDDPFFLPGLQDVTTHVDFTAVRDAAVENGLSCLGFATQAQFLINCGITEIMLRVPPNDALRYLPLAAEAQKLLSPSEMGELFKVIALGRGVDAPLKGFSAGDMRARL
jgi:SAM-dependent MidA family methyltransferase